MVTKKYTEVRHRPKMLQAVFTLAEEMLAKILEAELFECTSTYRLPSTVNELCNSNNAEINKILHGRYNQQSYGNSDGYKGNYQKNGQKVWHNKDKKPWNKDNNDSKPWQNKDKKPWQNKESKPKDTCFTCSKDIKFFCPAGLDESIFAAVCKLLQEKVGQVKKAGADNTKTIPRQSMLLRKDDFIHFFNIPENIYDAAICQINGEVPPKIMGNSSN